MAVFAVAGRRLCLQRRSRHDLHPLFAKVGSRAENFNKGRSTDRFRRDQHEGVNYHGFVMLHPLARFLLLSLFAAGALPATARAEPIPVPAAFIALSKPYPANWKSQRFIVTVESAATGGKAARVRVEKSSGDTRADKIAVDYVGHLLNLKPDLRAKNVANQMVFPLLVDAATVTARPDMHSTAAGDVVYRRGLPGYEIPPPEWPRNGDNFGSSNAVVVRVVFGSDGNASKVELLKPSGSDFADGVVTRWAQSHWKCTRDKAGSALIVPIAARTRQPGNLQGGHKPFNVDPRNQEPSVGRSTNP